MLNAQNKEKPLASIDPERETAVPSSFGTVLNSVQGLQQRLGDFTVESISQAESSAKTLIQQLTELEKKLRRVAAIQQSVAVVRRQMNQVTTESIDLPNLRALDNPVRIHALVQASNLIRFPGPGRTSKENGKSLLVASALKIFQSDAPNPTRESTADQRVEVIGNDDEERAPVLEETGVPGQPNEQVLATKLERDDALMLPAAALGDAMGPHADSPSLADEELLPTSETPLSAIDAAAPIPSSQTPEPELPAAASMAEFATIEEAVLETKVAYPANVDFDQQLLDDLIKNYGEFVGSSAVSSPIEPSAPPARPARNHPAAIEFRIPESNSIKRGVPGARKDGELDRELKKIIKDYGEYDLYSRHRLISLKTGGIAALVLLGALLAGFYFFSSPKTPAVDKAPEARSTTPSPQMEAPTPSKEPTDGREKSISGRKGTATESQRADESTTP